VAINYRLTGRTPHSRCGIHAGWRIVNSRSWNRRMRRSGHLLHRNALIHYGAVVNRVVIDDRRALINIFHLRRRQLMPAKIALGKIVHRDERKMVRSQPEIEVHSDRRAVETPSRASIEDGMGWHRRPAALITRAPPNHPRRSPRPIRHPHPTGAIMLRPTAIMKGRPTPRIIRLPEPAGVCVHPVAAVAIRFPGVIDHRGARLPAPAKPSQVHPGAVRQEIIVEVGYVRRRILNHFSR